MKKTLRILLVAGIAGMIGAAQARATALSDNRDTWERTGKDITMIVASGSVIYAGSMVCENGSQRAVPASDTSGYVVIGVAQAKADNSGVNYSATKTVTVRRGVFCWVNGDTFTDANIGDLAYVEDDQTVQKGASATYDVVAGVIIDVDSTGVWVDTYAIGGSGAASVTTLSASGAATLGSTLSVAGNSTLGGTTVAVTNNLTVGGTAAVTGAATVGGTLGVTGNSTLGGTTVAVTNNLTVAGTATVTGNASAANLFATSGKVYLSASTNYFGLIGTQLVFVVQGCTNVLDADIGN